MGACMPGSEEVHEAMELAAGRPPDYIKGASLFD